MKKILILLFTLAIFFTFAGCANTVKPVPENSAAVKEQTTDVNAPADPADNVERELLNIYRDGLTLNEAGYTYADIKDVMASKKVDGIYYYGASIADITGEDLSPIKGAFLEAADGYVSYVSNIDDLYLAAYSAKKGEYESVILDGKHVYGGVTGDSFNKGVVAVYLVSTPADFSVEIQKNGKKIGELTMSDFMKKTPMGEKKVPTGMFDGSFMYKGGAATYEGRFLGISYEMMLAKLASLNMDLSGTITDVEYYGTTGAGHEGKNEEYSTTEGDPKYFGSVDFFCMFDGMTYNNITADYPIGLTAFINGTGGRWMTYNLKTINFVVE